MFYSISLFIAGRLANPYWQLVRLPSRNILKPQAIGPQVWDPERCPLSLGLDWIHLVQIISGID